MAMRSRAVDVPAAQRRMELRSQVRCVDNGGEQKGVRAGGAWRLRVVCRMLALRGCAHTRFLAHVLRTFAALGHALCLSARY